MPPDQLDGGTRTVVEERPRRGFVAWLRRRTWYVADPEPVTVKRTEQVPSMPARDVELLAVYALSHRGVF